VNGRKVSRSDRLPSNPAPSRDRQVDLPDQGAVECEDLDLRMRVLQVRGNEPIAD